MLHAHPLFRNNSKWSGQVSRVVRRGFTLVELLVVIAIIGILIALLMPAIQAAREAARRSQCVNNLKQIGIALHNHHDAKKELPPGAVHDNICCQGSIKATYSGWTIEILPYMEDENLRSLYDEDLSIGRAEAQEFRETLIPVYTCPSDHTPELANPESGPEAGWGSGKQLLNMWMTSSYRGMSGRTEANTTWYMYQRLGSTPYGCRGPLHVVALEGNEHFFDSEPYKLHPERFSKITDGLSKTILVAESTNTYNRRRTFWAHTFGDYVMSQAWLDSRMFLGEYEVCYDLGTNKNPCKAGWHSLHPNGMNALRCDGSVTFVTFDVDLETFAAMASVACEEVESL